VTSFRAWTTLLLVSALFFIITAATFTSLGLALNAMVPALHWNYGEAGAGFSLLAVLCGITSTVPAALIRRVGVRANFLVGAAVMALAFWALAATQGLPLYFLGTALAGFGFSLLATVPGTYLLTRLFVRPAFAFGLYFTIGGLGGVAGPPLYFWLAGPGNDWRTFWGGMGAAVVLTALATTLFSSTGSDLTAGGEADPDISAEGWTARAAMRTGQFAFLAIAYTAFLIAGITANATSVVHLTEHGVRAETAGYLMSVEAAVNAGARFLGGLLNAVAGARTLLAAALLALVVGLLALAFGRALPALLVYAAGIGIGYGLAFFASTILLLDYFGRRPNLELFAMVNLISTVGAAAPALAGLTRDHAGSFIPFYLLLAVLMAAIAIIALFLKKPHLAPP
jgi:MFS transporter, OFA family, oxalate/formate antiporter